MNDNLRKWQDFIEDESPLRMAFKKKEIGDARKEITNEPSETMIRFFDTPNNFKKVIKALHRREEDEEIVIKAFQLMLSMAVIRWREENLKEAYLDEQKEVIEGASLFMIKVISEEAKSTSNVYKINLN